MRPDGKAIWTQINVVLVQFDDGSPRCFIGQIQDISLRRQLTEALNERQHELEAANDKLQQLARWTPSRAFSNRRAPEGQAAGGNGAYRVQRGARSASS